MKEQWKDVQGYGGHYEASSLGRVRSKARTVYKRTRWGGVMEQHYPQKMLKPSREKGYLRVHLSVGGQKRKAWVHTLVLCAFHGQPESGQVCRHLDGKRDNNKPENLFWGTHLENMKDRKRHGRYGQGESHHMAKLTAKEVSEIRVSSLSARDAAKVFNISESHIYTIRSGEVWRHVA